MELRAFQNDLTERVRLSFKQGYRAPLVVAPTGAGKTVLFSEFTRRTVANGKRVLILAHRTELLSQISQTLLDFKVPHAMVSPHQKFTDSQVHVASVFTLVRRLEAHPEPDLIIIDEAHHAILKSTWGKILTRWPRAFRLGLSATPCRLSGEPLKELFDSLLIGPSVLELTDLGYLSPYRIFAPTLVNTDNLHKRAGDFVASELNDLMDRPTITGSAVAEYLKIAPGKRAVVFCTGIEHAANVALEFQRAGVTAQSVDGTMDRDTRAKVINDFKSGSLMVLTSCQLVSEGFDCPHIDVAIDLAPTASLSLCMQRWGRALRIHPGKREALIIDHVKNYSRHGLPCTPREWTLDGNVQKNSRQSDPLAIKQCPACYYVLKPGPPACPNCGTAFTPEPRTIKEIQGELTELNKLAIQADKLNRMKERTGANGFEELVALGRKRGYKSPESWAWFVDQSRRKKKNGKH